MRLGLREANQRFSKAIKAVRAGTEVVLTERGRPIAVIKPLGDEHAEEAALRAMAAEGFVVPPSKKGPMPSPRWRPVDVKGKPLSQTVIDDRAEGA
jgi:prevent-host-death family protein